MNKYKQMFLEQNRPKGGQGEMQEELSFLFDVINPYQHWIDAHHTTISIRRNFRIKYNNDISNYVK
jgi:hypothetical protein